MCNSSSRKEGFEEKASDQNKEREPGGRGQREAGEEGVSGLGEPALMSQPSAIPLCPRGERGLLRGWGLKRLRKGGEATRLSKDRIRCQ